jgi:hypothetical protein
LTLRSICRRRSENADSGGSMLTVAFLVSLGGGRPSDGGINAAGTAHVCLKARNRVVPFEESRTVRLIARASLETPCVTRGQDGPLFLSLCDSAFTTKPLYLGALGLAPCWERFASYSRQRPELHNGIDITIDAGVNDRVT